MKNKLTIYLIKKNIENENVLKDIYNLQELEINKENCKIYYRNLTNKQPYWLESFLNFNDKDFVLANVDLIILIDVQIDDEIRKFAICFGHSKLMLCDNVIEEQFGLKVILNSINSNDIRKISKKSIGTNQKQSEEQMPRKTDINEFGFDINRDLIKGISAKSNDILFENCMLTGYDMLSVSVNKNINNIDAFLKDIYLIYKKDIYRANFDWIDNIKYEKDKKVINNLDNKIIQLLNERDFSANNVWMAVPEVVDWTKIKCFKILCDDNEYDDIEIENVLNSFRKELTDVNQLKKKQIRAISSIDEKDYEYNWNAYRCLIAEIELNGNSYCLNDGKWFILNKDFSKRINDEFNKISKCGDEFIDYQEGDNEDKYNEKLSDFLIGSKELHKTKISIGGGSGNSVEPCDVFWKNKFIFIKKGNSSSLLSHLFNQAYVSASSLLDVNTRNILEEKSKLDFSNFKASNYEIVIGIINERNEFKIPFFSKVTLCHTNKEILKYGYKFSVKNINVIKNEIK